MNMTCLKSVRVKKDTRVATSRCSVKKLIAALEQKSLKNICEEFVFW